MSLYVHETGPADTPAIVFLHGLGLSGAMWQPQLERLSDYHCLAPDLPEHGKSTDVGLITLENASRCVADLIRKRTANGHAHVVGLSMGGAIAVQLLCDAPEIVDTAIESGASARLGPVLAALNRLNEPIIRIFRPDQFVDLMLRTFNIPPQYRGLLLEDMRTFKAEAITHWSQQLTKIVLPRNTRVPTLIVVGQKETFVAKNSAREMSRTIPGAKGVMVPGVGHVWSLEAPDLFTEMVRAWVTGGALPQELVAL